MDPQYSVLFGDEEGKGKCAEDNKSKSLSTGVIISIVVPIVVGITLIAVTIFIFYPRLPSLFFYF